MGTVMPQDGRKTTENNVLDVEHHKGEKFFSFSAQTQTSCENIYYVEEGRVEVCHRG